jgi:glucose/arabinose dehydrogenase
MLSFVWRMKTRVLVAAIATLLSAVSAGCGSAHHTASTTQSAAGSTPSATTGPAQVPNPFRIVARYSVASLGLKNPRKYAVGPNGNLFITDATDRVSEVSPAGKVLRRWGGRGKQPGEFSFVGEDTRDPTDIAAGIAVGPNGDVYVSDSGNERVEVFSATGHFIREFGSSLTNLKGHFLLPGDLVVDQSGDVYVADQQQNVVEKYSPTGAFVWQSEVVRDRLTRS